MVARLLVASILSIVSCRPSSIEAATGAAHAALGATRMVVDESVAAHQVATRAAIEACGHLIPEPATPEQRESCLTDAGFGPAQVAEFERGIAAVREAYDLIVEALDLLEGGWREASRHLPEPEQ